MTELNILLIRDVVRMTRLSRRTIQSSIQHGTFPKPFKIANKNAWFESTIVNWLFEQSEKDGAA